MRRSRLLDDGKTDDAGVMLFKAKLGQPRNKALMRLLEDPVNRRALDKAELVLLPGLAQRRAVCIEGRTLFYHRREGPGIGSIREIGREFLNPDDR